MCAQPNFTNLFNQLLPILQILSEQKPFEAAQDRWDVIRKKAETGPVAELEDVNEKLKSLKLKGEKTKSLASLLSQAWSVNHTRRPTIERISADILALFPGDHD